MLVYKFVIFNGESELTQGEVISSPDNEHWLVEFIRKGVIFRGYWRKTECY